jgi:hemerythrin-like domain-containing protein
MPTPDTSTAPDLSVLFAIHHALAEDAVALTKAANDLRPEDRSERIPSIRSFFDHYTAQLVAHHTHEDEIFFPALDAKVGATAMSRAELDAQHEELDEGIQRVRSALAAIGDDRTDFATTKARLISATNRLERQLATHFELEESTAIPHYQRTMSAAEHAVLEARVQAAGTFEELQFMVPWLFDRLPAVARDRALEASPDIFAIVYNDQVLRYRTYQQALAVRSDTF